MPEVAPLGTSGISDIQPQSKVQGTRIANPASAGFTMLEPGASVYQTSYGYLIVSPSGEQTALSPSRNVIRPPTELTNVRTTAVSQVAGTGGTFASEGKPAAPTTRTIESGGIRTTTDMYGNVLSREIAPIQLPPSELAQRKLSPEERQALGRASPGTITDIGRAKAAGYITEQEASKIEMLRSGSAQFASESTFRELAANTPAYFEGAKGTLVNPQFKSGQEQLNYIAQAARQSVTPQPGHAMIQPSPSIFVDPKYGLMIRSDLPSAQPGMPKELQPRITTPASGFYTYPLYKSTSDFTKWVSSGLEGFTGYTREQSIFSRIVVGAGSGLAAIPEGLATAGIGAEALIRNYKQAPVLVGAGFVSTVGGLEKGFTERPIETTSGFLAQLFAGKVASKVPVEKLPTIGIGKPKGVIVEVGEVPISPKTGFEAGYKPEATTQRLAPNIPISSPKWAVYTPIKPGSVLTEAAIRSTQESILGRPLGIGTGGAMILASATTKPTTPKEKYELFAGEPRIKETTIKQRELMGTPEGTLGDLTFEQSIRQPVATLYIKPPKSAIGDIMNAFTGQIEYIKTPEGSFMKIKPTGISDDFINSFTNWNRQISGTPKQVRIGEPTPKQPSFLKIPSISDYIRIERKLSLEPATISRTTTQARKALPEVTWDIETGKEAPRPGKPMEYDIYGGMVKGKGMQPKEPLVSGIPERLQLTTRQVSDLDVYLSMARKERAAAPKAEPLAPKETFVSQATIDLSESVRTALEEPGIKGERSALFDVATQLKPKMVDIQNVIPPRSPVTIETKAKQHQAVGLAEKMAKDLQGLGIAAEARGTKVIQKGKPADVIGNIEYFDQKKIDMYNLPYEKLSMDRFNMYPNIAMSGQYKFVGTAGDIGILGKFYGNNFIDSPLMGLDIVGITEPRRKHRPLYSPDYIPTEAPSPFITPFPGTAPAPSPKPTKFPTPYPDIYTPTIPDMGFDIGKPPKIPMVDFERKKRKKLRKGKGGYFQTFRATPLIQPLAGLKDMFKSPAKKTYKKSRKGRR